MSNLFWLTEAQMARLEPFERSLLVPPTYALTYPPEHATRPALRSFRSWLLGYARRQTAELSASNQLPAHSNT